MHIAGLTFRPAWLRTGRTVLLALFVGFFLSCGGGGENKVKDEGDVSIDQLLGIEGEQQKKGEETKQPQEDEVLKLLGINPEEGKKAETKEAQPAPKEPSIEELRAQVQQLEQQLSEKDRIIQQLRKDLNEKDRRLQELQTQALASRTATPATRPATTVSGTFRERYQAALNLYHARRYREAIDAFSALLAEDPNNSLSDNCQYWIGECYYGLGNYQQAVAEFEKVFAYPNSNKADAALLKLGITYLALGDRSSARAQFEQLIASYPKSEYVEKARSYLSRLQ